MSKQKIVDPPPPPQQQINPDDGAGTNEADSKNVEDTVAKGKKK